MSTQSKNKAGKERKGNLEDADKHERWHNKGRRWTSKGHGQQGTYHHKYERTGALPELPILRPPGGDNPVDSERNLINFRQAIATYVRREFGDIADIFTVMSYPEYDEVEYEEDDLKKANDPYGLKRREIEKLMCMRIEKMDRLTTNKPRVYALIIGQLSQESLDKVRQMPNWDTFDNEGDPLELMKRVMATHLIRSSVDMERTKLEAREAFTRCRQQYNETIVQFKQRYDGRIAALKTLDEHILEEPALAIDFIHKLDMRRYHELRKDYENGLYDRVTSLAEAYELASNFVVERRSERGTFRVFVADGRSKRGGRSGGRGREGRGGRSSSRRWGPSADRPCAICQSPTHWANDCPDKDDKGDVGEDKQKGSKNRVRFMNALAIIPDDVLSKGDMHDVYDESDNDVLLNLVNNSTYKGAEHRCTVSPSVLAAVSSLTDHDVVLDTGAGVSVFKNANHLVDIRDDHVPIEINDLTVTNEPLCTSTLGSSEFGDVYVSEHSIANILFLRKAEGQCSRSVEEC